MKKLLFIFVFICSIVQLKADTNEIIKFGVTNWAGAFTSTRPFAFQIGDSIAAGYNDHTTSDEGGPTGEPLKDGLHLISLMSGVPFFGTNHAFSGAQLSGYVYNSAFGAIAHDCRIGIVEGGINDISAGKTFEDVRATNIAILNRCKLSNTVMIIEEVLPWTTALNNAITNWNASLNEFAATNFPYCRVAKTHDVLADPTDNRILLATNTFDGQHLTLIGQTQRCLVILTQMIASLCVTSTTPGSISISNAIASARPGDTIIIPSGLSNIVEHITVTNSLFFKAAGAGSTILTNNTPVDNLGLFAVTLASNRVTRFSGIEFWHGTVAGTDPAIILTGSDIDERRYRVDNCKFSYMYGSALRINTAMGVFDHNTLYGRLGYNSLAHIKNSTWSGLANGNGIWSNATARLGTKDNCFFEDNVLVGTNEFNVLSLIDMQAGGRAVFRYNIVTNAYVEGHGSEASYERSTHAAEVYFNAFYQQNKNQFVTYYRGGCIIAFSNAINDVTSPNCLHLLNNRMNDPLFTPFGGSDGRNHWDVNDAGNPFVAETITSASLHTATVSGASWTTNQWVGAVIRATSGKSVTSINRSGTTITVVCPSHGFTSNDLVSIFGADQQEYNNRYGYWTSAGTEADTRRLTIVDANTFTTSTGESLPTTPATGTILARKGNFFSEITANTGTQITFNASAYEALTTNYSLLFYTGDTFEINKITHSMDQIGRTGGSLIDSTATPSFPAGWNNQTTSPCYQWGNNRGNQSGIAFTSASGSIRAGVHFFNDTIMPSYTNFIYPHYLVTAGGTSSGFTSETVSKLHGKGPLHLKGPIHIK